MQRASFDQNGAAGAKSKTEPLDEKPPAKKVQPNTQLKESTRKSAGATRARSKNSATRWKTAEHAKTAALQLYSPGLCSCTQAASQNKSGTCCTQAAPAGTTQQRSAPHHTSAHFTAGHRTAEHTKTHTRSTKPTPLHTHAATCAPHKKHRATTHKKRP